MGDGAEGEEDVIFKATHTDFEITANMDDVVPIFTCDALLNQYGNLKPFNSLKSLLAALDAYELSLRKNFTNPTAYRFVRFSYGNPETVEEVTVTSTDGKEAWVKTVKGKREKCRINSLYADRDNLQAYLDAVAEVQRELKERTAALEEKLMMWHPVTSEARP